jgi:hypothetical protein
MSVWAFRHLENKERVAPELIDAFLVAGAAGPAIGLVVKGTEKDHLEAMKIYWNKSLALESLHIYHPQAHLWEAIRKLSETGDRVTLLQCHEQILKAHRFPKEPLDGSFRFIWAGLWLALHAEEPLEGFQKIESEFPPECVSPIRKAYFHELAEKNYGKELIELWLAPLPGETPAGRLADALDWDSIWSRDAPTDTERRVLARAIARKWNEMPEAEKARLSEIDADRFLLAFARDCERGRTDATREGFLRILKEPSGRLFYNIKARYLAGDKDLRPQLIEKAFSTEDPQQAFDILHALHNWLGGEPPEVADRMRQIARQPSDNERDANCRASIMHILEPPPPIHRPTSKPVPPYRDSMIPWRIRRDRQDQAIAHLHTLQAAANSYHVDYSQFPPRLSCMTSPIQYIDFIQPDLCAPSGPYLYQASILRYRNFAVASTGPDGNHDISLRHFLLVMDLIGGRQGKEPPSPYVRWTPRGYEFPKEFTPGADIVLIRY